MIATHPAPSPTSRRNATAKILLLEATCFVSLRQLLSQLEAAFPFHDLWLHRRADISAQAAELHLEIHRHAIPSLCLVLTACGLYVSHPGRTALSSLCSRRHPIPISPIEIRLALRHDPNLQPATDN